MLADCHFPAKDTPTFIPGPTGNLEAILVGPENSAAMQGVGIICHPHPLYSGTMRNKVITTLAKTFKELGLGVVRFNFRGVGKSAGKYDHAKGEVDDLIAVINWIKKNCPNRAIWLAGFSFGSFIAAKVASQQSVAKLILIAPPVNHFDFNELPPFTAPTFILQGDLDEVVPATEVYAWVNNLKNAPQLIKFPTATHFFHSHLGQLHDKLFAALNMQSKRRMD